MIDTKCKESVIPKERWGSFHKYQCTRNIWKDGYCKIHHPETKKKRDELSQKRFNGKTLNNMRLKRANARIQELEAEVERLRLCPPIIK